MLPLLLALNSAAAQDAVACADGALVPGTAACTHNSIGAAFTAAPAGGVVHVYGDFLEQGFFLDKSITFLGQQTTDGQLPVWQGTRQQGQYWILQENCGANCSFRFEDLQFDVQADVGVFLQQGASAHLERVTFFSSNTQAGSVAADFAGPVTCIDCEFRDMVGGVTILGLPAGVDATFTGGAFRRIQQDGQVVIVQNADLVMDGTVFEDVSASVGFLVQQSNATFRNMAVTGGELTNAVFQLDQDGGTFVIEDTTISGVGGSAAVQVGTSAVPSTSTATLRRVTFDGQAVDPSGGIQAYGGTLDLQDVTFTNLRSASAVQTTDGGSISWIGGGVNNSVKGAGLVFTGSDLASHTLDQLAFENNDLRTTQTISNGFWIGTVALLGASNQVTNSVFRGNQANNAAALTIRGGGLVDNNLFDGNTASAVLTDDGYGGALMLNTASAVVTNNVFQHNSAVNGGAVHVYREGVQSSGNLFCANNASATGGAVYVGARTGEAIPAYSHSSRNDVYVENAAIRGAGLGASDVHGFDITHATAWANSATEGSFARIESGAGTVTNSVVADHTGGAALWAETGTLAADFSLFWNNTVDSAGGTSISTSTFQDPLLTAMSADGNCGNDNWTPLAGPAIDAGDPGSANDGDGSRPDLGATGGPTPFLPDLGTTDADGDGFDSSVDCNDTDRLTYPGAPEQCDGADNDCDNATDENLDQTWFYDGDGDGSGNNAITVVQCDPPADHVGSGGDCDDAEPTTYPNATELCDLVDNDCDITIDEGLTQFWYTDADGDGFGTSVPEVIIQCPSPGTGYVLDNTDCDDGEQTTYPGAPELCDGVSNDCDVAVDESVVTSTWYADSDGDGFGDPLVSQQDCAQPDNFVGNNTDCDDETNATYPGATEVCDTEDNDCDSSTDEELARPWYADADDDSYGDPQVTASDCQQPTGFVGNALDCDDLAPLINPAGNESCDEVDNDCDALIDEGQTSTYFEDTDGDGFYGTSVEACTQPAGTSEVSDDCDETATDVHEGATETCDERDEDCDQLVDEGVADPWYIDDDGDGFMGTLVLSCTEPAGASTEPTDCDDTDGGIYPGAAETCDLVDEDCDERVDESAIDQVNVYQDADMDGWGAGEPEPACEGVELAGDCDDNNPGIHPRATDLPNDGLDQDCDGRELQSVVGGRSCSQGPPAPPWLGLAAIAWMRRRRTRLT